MGVLDGLAMAAKEVGSNVIDGMKGDMKSYTKRYGKRVLKSNEAIIKNMSADNIGSVIRQGMKNDIKKISGDAAVKAIDAKVSKAAVNMAKKGIDKSTISSKLIKGTEDKLSMKSRLLGRELAKNDLSYRIGDAIGGGVRDAMRSRKAGHDMKTAMMAGFTKAGKEGKRELRVDRVAGAAFGVGVAGRVATGGGLYRDRYGRVNVPGVPFI